MPSRSHWRHGFTLIELMVVVSIISILTSIAYVNFKTTQDKGRDSKRKQDLKAVSAALLSYYQDNQAYPPACVPSPCASTGQYTSDGAAPWIPELTSNYLQNLPKDPKQASIQIRLGSIVEAAPPTGDCLGKNDVYCYIVAPDRQSFLLWAQLDRSNDPESTGKSGATCKYTSPGGNTKWNFCIESSK